VAEDARVRPGIRVVCPHGEENFDLSEVVDTIGRALTNVLLSREEKAEIFSDANKVWVENVARTIGDTLERRAIEEKPVRITLGELYALIEAKLVEHRAYEVAKSILMHRSRKLGASNPEQFVAVRLIRRNGHIVPWNEAKIEIAVRKAFLSLERDSAPAVEIARAVTRRVVESKQAFMDIEEVQDLVQEEMMRAGHFKVAEHYIIYRRERALLRDSERVEPATAPEQNQLVVV
jgi:ribonucleoside-diphosphate reductase alpha chain